MAPPLRSLLLFGGALALVAGPRSRHDVRAGDYHDRGTLDCSQCHVMHLRPAQSQASGLHGGSAVAGALLRADVNALCLSCHDGSSRATDVLGRNQGRAPGDVRQAGFLNAVGRDGLEATGHTLYSLEQAPGSDPPWNAADGGLDCIDCHAPHGSLDGGPSTYRNLRSDAGNNLPGEGLVTYALGANDLSRDVFVRSARSYDESAVDFNEPDRRDSAIARFCAGCHDRFHGVPGADAHIGGRTDGHGMSEFVRHPSSGVDLGALGGEHSRSDAFLALASRVKVLSPTGSWSAPGDGLTPTCISCHKAHGNDNPFGLIFRSGRGSPTENGDTRGTALEDLCRQCHPPSGFAD